MRSSSSSSVHSTPTSTSKCSESSATPESPIFSFTRTFRRSLIATRVCKLDRAGWASCREPLYHPVDAGRERLHVGGIDRGEHPHPQLIATQLAVGLDVDDAVRA